MKANKNPLVSIIINCFNGEEFLRKSLESIINQTYTNWEIIFWDNRSTDNSPEIFNSYKDKRFKYFKAEEFTTLYVARNKALLKCEGEFIAFLDVDDWWELEKIKKQIKILEDESVGLVYANSIIHNEQSKKKTIFQKKKLPSGNVTERILTNYPIGISTVVIRKKILTNNNLTFNSNYSVIGDFDLFTNLSLLTNFIGIDETLSNYRLHESNDSFLNRDTWINELGVWLDKNKNKFGDRFKRAFKAVELNLNYLKIKFKILEGNYKESFFDIIKFPFKIEKLKLVCIYLLIIFKIKKHYDFK